jgi:hypothetical protein
MLYRETTIVYCNDQMKNIHKLCGQNADLLVLHLAYIH